MINWKFWKKKPKSIAEIAEAHRAAHKQKLEEWGWGTLGSKPEMIWAHTDENGNNYYVPRNLWQGVSRDRLSAIEAASTAIEHRMGREQILASMLEIMADFRKCQSADLQAAAEGYRRAWEIHDIMRTAPSEQVLIEYALHTIYTDGENPETLDPEFINMKRKNAESDQALRAFFLTMAQSTVSNSLPTSPPVGRNSSEMEAGEAKKKKEATRRHIENFMRRGRERGS